MSEPAAEEETARSVDTRTVGNGAAIAVAIGVMNIATYGFTILAARALGPQQYGAFAAVMNLLMVVSVAQLALQATGARRISSTPADVSVIESGIRRLTWLTALSLGTVLLLAAPLINYLLRLESLRTAVLVGAIAVPLTVMGGQAGTLQGERRWRGLALLYAAAGVPRLLVGSALILWQPDEFTAILAVFIGALAPVAVGAVALRDRAHHSTPPSAEDHGIRALVRELGHNSQALLAFFAVTNVDVILARGVLGNADSGLYAGGLILTKAVLFLPQFVVVVAFPNMADSRERDRALRLSLGAVAALGVIGVAVTFALSHVALVFVGGQQYGGIEDRLWQFAVLGTLLSMIQLLVYALIAQRGGRATWLLWGALVAIVAGAQLVGSISALLMLVLVVDSVLLVGLLVPLVFSAAKRTSAR
ncbi:MAG: lipopolysaccharide biosynthesis protein [Nocardioides sp.]